MPARAQPQRHDAEPAYVLHAYPYRETSLIIEAFAENFGRVATVARGAKRPRSELRGVLQAFQPLLLSWYGQQELKTLLRAEWRGGLPQLGGRALLCGFYLNELVLKLVPREDPHRELYASYERALAQLAAGAAQAPVLRAFELDLVAAVGYALALTHEADSGAAIDAACDYHYAFDRGPLRAAPPGPCVRVRGATLIALAQRRWDDGASAAEAKRLMRDVIDHLLERRGVQSRRVVQDLQALEEQEPEGSPR
jgi:DNA repair protein RecO (recombination protein O)